jgi:S-formylglutathione hydrolase
MIEAYDFGQGAGFYVDATQDPWAAHFRMRSYVEQELPALIAAEFPADMARQGITGHSMGGHGALTVGLRNPDRFRSGLRLCADRRAQPGALGPEGAGRLSRRNDRCGWRPYDAVRADRRRRAPLPELLVDQATRRSVPRRAGAAPRSAARSVRRKRASTLTLRLQPGYDHSYYFVSSFLADHVAWHAERLKRMSRYDVLIVGRGPCRRAGGDRAAAGKFEGRSRSSATSPSCPMSARRSPRNISRARSYSSAC